MFRFITLCMMLAMGSANGQNHLAAEPSQHEHARPLLFSRSEVVTALQPNIQTYLTVVEREHRQTSRRDGTALRIERVFTRVLANVKYLRADAQNWNWRIVLLSHVDEVPFAMPGGEILVSTKWVRRLRLTDPELALVLAHEMTHVVAEHMLERIAELAANRPAANMSIADVIRMVREEWYVVREVEQLMQAQELQADRIGMELVCAAGFSRSHALGLFDKMHRDQSKQRGFSLVKSHEGPLGRKQVLITRMQRDELSCPP